MHEGSVATIWEFSLGGLRFLSFSSRAPFAKGERGIEFVRVGTSRAFASRLSGCAEGHTACVTGLLAQFAHHVRLRLRLVPLVRAATCGSAACGAGGGERGLALVLNRDATRSWMANGSHTCCAASSSHPGYLLVDRPTLVWPLAVRLGLRVCRSSCAYEDRYGAIHLPQRRPTILQCGSSEKALPTHTQKPGSSDA